MARSRQRRGPTSIARFLRTSSILLVAAVLVMGVIGIGGILLTYRSSNQVTRKLGPLRLGNRSLLQFQVDAETSVRGYVVTHDQRFLVPYLNAVSGFPDSARQARRQAAGHGQIQHDLDLQSLQFAGWNRTIAGPAIAGVRSGGDPRALISLIDVGRTQVDRFRLLNAQANQHIESARNDQLGQLDRRAWGSGTLILIAMVGIAIAGITRGRAIDRRLTVPLGDIEATIR